MPETIPTALPLASWTFLVLLLALHLLCQSPLRRALTFQLGRLLEEPANGRAIHNLICQLISGIVQGHHSSRPEGRVLELLSQHHAVAVVDAQLLLEVGFDVVVEACRREDPVNHAPLQQLLGRGLLAKDVHLVGAMHADAVGKVLGRAVLGDQGERGKGNLQVRAIGSKDDVGNAREPGGATTDSWAVESEDEDLLMIDEGADELDAWRGRGVSRERDGK